MKKLTLSVAIGLTALCYAETPTKNERFDLALSRADHTLIKKALDDGASLSKRDPFGRTALMNAAWKGNEEIVALLLLRGANIDAKDKLGSTALHKAVRSGNLKVVLLLLSEGAVIDDQDNEGNTPLHVATELNSPAMVKLLIKNNANTALLNKEEKTAEQLATDNHLYEATKAFKEMAQSTPDTPSRKRKRVYTVVDILKKKS